MKTTEMVKNTLNAMNKHQLYNPWLNYHLDDYVLDEDKRKIESFDYPVIDKKIMWDSTTKYEFKNQFPVPINGNFLKSKYLLLYSNPGTERSNLDNYKALNSDLNVKEALLKCFRLELDAKLVIPINNKQWEKWYIGELDKFFVLKKTEVDDFKIDEFLDDFCFINLFAYPTKDNQFDFDKDELQQLHSLPSTQFVKKLVDIGIEAGKQIVIIRRSEGVWKHSTNKNYMFDKLITHYNNKKGSNHGKDQ